MTILCKVNRVIMKYLTDIILFSSLIGVIGLMAYLLKVAKNHNSHEVCEIRLKIIVDKSK